MGYIRYLYAPSHESQASRTNSQDYLTWRYEKDTLVFVICDGVSGSFFGDIAAKFLGDRLLEELHRDLGSELAAMDTDSERKEKMTQCLNDWARDSHDKVEKVELSQLPFLHREALRGLRDQYGSETVFVCGRISFHDSNQDPTLMLIWMGNSPAYLFSEEKPIPTGGEWDHNNRWSTKLGVRNKLHIETKSISEHRITRIIATSDGLKSDNVLVAATKLLGIDDTELQNIVDKELKLPSSDDISFIDIHIKTAASSAESLQTPVLSISNDQLSWSEVKDSSKSMLPTREYWLKRKDVVTYEVEESYNGVFFQPTPHETDALRWDIPKSQREDMTAYRYFRVRAKKGTTVSLWSSFKSTRPEPPKTPVLKITATSNDCTSFDIEWSETVEGQIYTLVEQKSDSNAAQEIYVDPDRKQSISGKIPGFYSYWVIVGAGGYGTPGEECFWEIPPILQQTQPDQSGPFALQWQAGDDGICVLERSDNPHFDTAQKVYEGKDRLWQPTDPLAPGRYYFRIRFQGSRVCGEVCKVIIENPPKIVEMEHTVDAEKNLEENQEDQLNPSDSPNIQPIAKPLATVPPHKSAGESGASHLVATPKSPALSAPKWIGTVYPVTVNQSYTVKWSKVDGAHDYELQVAKSNIFAQLNQGDRVYKDIDVSYTDRPTEVKQYCYRVKAIGDRQESEWSEWLNIEVHEVKETSHIPKINPIQEDVKKALSTPSPFSIEVSTQVERDKPEWVREQTYGNDNEEKGVRKPIVYLSWTRKKWAVKYELESTNNNPQSNENPKTVMPISPNKPNSSIQKIRTNRFTINSNYTFRVRGIDKGGTEGEWSYPLHMKVYLNALKQIQVSFR